MAGVAVTREPVSQGKFPLTGKNTGKIPTLLITWAIKTSISLAFSGFFSEWSEFVTGNEQGSNRERNRD
jgi:hypothetical protein